MLAKVPETKVEIPSTLNGRKANGDQNEKLGIRLDDPTGLYDKKPGVLGVLSNSSDIELKEMKEKLKGNLSLLKAYESDVDDWARIAGSLKEELKQNTPKEEQESEQWKKLYDALDNASKLGKSSTSNVI